LKTGVLFCLFYNHEQILLKKKLIKNVCVFQETRLQVIVCGKKYYFSKYCIALIKLKINNSYYYLNLTPAKK